MAFGGGGFAPLDCGLGFGWNFPVNLSLGFDEENRCAVPNEEIRRVKCQSLTVGKIIYPQRLRPGVFGKCRYILSLAEKFRQRLFK